MRRRRGGPGFTPVGWDELWADVGARWHRFDQRARPMLHVAAAASQRDLLRRAEGHALAERWHNVDSSARLCRSPSTSAMKDALGVAAASTCSYTDWYDANVLVFLGSNPASDQPVAMKYMLAARQRCARVLVVNAFREPGLERYWVPSATPRSATLRQQAGPAPLLALVRVGGDLAFLQRRGARAAGARRTGGGLRGAGDGRLRRVARGAGKAPADGRALARLRALAGHARESRLRRGDRARRQGRCSSGAWASQHAHGGDTVRAIANLGLLREWVGRPDRG
jgi:anaerobic selenocysteine-containing dehydrogenase